MTHFVFFGNTIILCILLFITLTFFLLFWTRTGIQRPLWERRELKPPMRAKRKKEKRKRKKKMQRREKSN